MMKWSRFILGLLAFLCAAGLTTTAEASHWRFGHATWRLTPDPNDNPRAVEITVQEGWRSTLIGSNTYNFGDGSGSFSTSGATTIATGTDIAGESFTIRRTVVTHTYPNDGPFLVAAESCCRILSVVNASSDSSFRMELIIDLSNGNTGSPVASIPVILQMVQGGVNTIPLAIADPDGDAFSCRMATFLESQIPTVATAGGHTLSVSSDCILTWDTSGTSISQKYAAQVIITEGDAPPPPPGPPTGTPIELRFIVGFVDALAPIFGPSTFAFSLNGTPVGSFAPTSLNCINQAPLVVTLNDPGTLALIGAAGTNLVEMDLTTPAIMFLTYVRAEIVRTDGVETACLFVGTGVDCQDRDACVDNVFVGSSSYDSQTWFQPPPPPPPPAPKVALDFIVEIVGGTINTPPTCAGDTGNQGTIAVGQPVTLSFVGDDADGDPLTINHFGLPVGATLTPAAGTTAASPMPVDFDWTPTAADAGSSVSVSMSYTDSAGLQAICSFSLTVLDVLANQPPTVTCPVASDFQCDGSPPQATVSLTVQVDDADGDGLTVTWFVDNVSQQIDVVAAASVLPANVSFNNAVLDLGAHTVEVIVDDGTETDSCTTVVTVVDTIPPVAFCLADVTVDTDPGDCFASGVALGQPQVSENCQVDTVTNDAPGVFDLGTTSVTWTVTDVGGNSATCEQFVTVVDVEPPVAVCASGVIAPTDAGLCSATVILQAPAVSDNCGIASVTNDAPAPFPLGTTTVTWTVTDDAGNETPCTQDVTVEDRESPVVTCSVFDNMLGEDDVLWPPNHTLEAVGLNVDVSDNCDGDPVIAVVVFADEDDEEATGDGTHSPDAKDIASGTLRLRKERKGDADGRVYLIVGVAVDFSGNVGFSCCTVTVPHSRSPSDKALVEAQAAAAEAECLATGLVPAGFVVVGDGAVIGPKQ